MHVGTDAERVADRELVQGGVFISQSIRELLVGSDISALQGYNDLKLI